MASMFELLLESMPFAGAAQALRESKGKPFEELSVDEVKEHIVLLPEDTSFFVELPDLHEGEEPAGQPLWAWSYSSANPAEVGSVYCRVRDADYVGHQVADRIAWGLDEPGAAFQQAVRIVFQAGGEVLLPLSKDFVLWTFKLRNGHIAPDQTPLWRLESVHDTSLVVVFAYDVDPATGEITKMDFDRIRDPTIRDDVREMERAVKELLSGFETDTRADPTDSAPPASPSTPSDGSAASGSEKPWGARALKGDFWTTARSEQGPPGQVPLTGGVSGKVGDVCEISTEPARLLVVFSFTTCRERADFEPGGMVGFARCYPHLLVSTTVPVQRIEASARMDRPAEITKWHEENRDMKASCCKPPYDAWTPPIGGLLIADANEMVTVGLPVPFWSNFFFYHILDPCFEHQGRRFHVVRRDRPAKRESPTELVQRHTRGLVNPTLGPFGIIQKEARQGEFDNVHLAPRLRLMNVKSIVDLDMQKAESEGPLMGLLPGMPASSAGLSDRAAWGLDDIAMAPFCAHDCFHLHWRWATSADAKWSLGWSANGPYEVAGAPMVPLEQDVWFWFRRRASVTYHAVASQPRFVGDFHVLMHHGLGYAVAVANALKVDAAMVAVASFSNIVFTGVDGDTVSPVNSTAAYYWMARRGIQHDTSRALVPLELVSWATKGDLKAAMDL